MGTPRSILDIHLDTKQGGTRFKMSTRERNVTETSGGPMLRTALPQEGCIRGKSNALEKVEVESVLSAES
jgi:hypothetical protein